jgi:hypothetical protein
MMEDRREMRDEGLSEVKAERAAVQEGASVSGSPNYELALGANYSA